MKDFDIKRGHFKKIDDGGLKTLMEDTFGSVSEDDGVLVSSWGALEIIRVRVMDKKTLAVDTKMKTDVDDDTATGTILKYNAFMEGATGFNAKERKKRAQKATTG